MLPLSKSHTALPTPSVIITFLTHQWSQKPQNVWAPSLMYIFIGYDAV